MEESIGPAPTSLRTTFFTPSPPYVKCSTYCTSHLFFHSVFLMLIRRSPIYMYICPGSASMPCLVFEAAGMRTLEMLKAGLGLNILTILTIGQPQNNP